MTVYCETYAYCDECGDKTPVFESTSITSFKRSLRFRGWSFGKRDLCPHCNGRHEKLVDGFFEPFVNSVFIDGV